MRINLQKIGLLCFLVNLISMLGLGCSRQRIEQVDDPQLPLSILLISLDTLRADHLGCYGYPRQTSPFLDFYSRQGTLFSMAYSHDSSTVPSHMTLFTSLYPSAHGVAQRKQLHPEVITLAQVLQQNGYKTLGFTGGANVSAFFGFDRGFDTFITQDPLLINNDFSYIDSTIIPKIKKCVTGECKFFCFLHTYRIHDPYQPPRPYNLLYFDQESTKVKAASELSNQLPFIEKRQGFWNVFDTSEAPDRVMIEKLYDGEIRYTDTAMAYINSQLAKITHNIPLMTIILSDHGEEFYEHQGFLHTNKVYEELIHVPLLINLSKKENRNAIRPDRVGLIDILPTILKITGLQPLCSAEGVSLFEVDSFHARPMYAENMRRKLLKSSIQLDHWKYIIKHNDHHQELYDLENDPREQHNLITQQNSVRSFDLLQKKLVSHMNDNEQIFESIGAKNQGNLDRKTKKELISLGYIN